MIRVVVPYSKEVLDSIIYEYQKFFFPLQFLFILLSLWIVYSIWKNENKFSKFIVGVLSFFWIWTGFSYEIKYYTTINWFGLYIGSFFILQGLLFFWFGIIKGKLNFVKNRLSLILSIALVVIYPLVQFFNGKHHFELSIIGMLPDITVIFSLILLLLNIKKRVSLLLIIPIVWSLFSLYWNYALIFNLLEVSSYS